MITGSHGFTIAYPQFKGRERSVDCADPDLIKAIEELGLDTMPILKMVEIPDGVTDWELDEYDGLGSINYVLDGKLGTLLSIPSLLKRA